MENPAIRERSFMVLTTLAGLADGKEAIVGNKSLLANFCIGIEDPRIEVRSKVAACLEEIASFWKTADVLVENGFIEIILANLLIEINSLVIINLRILKSLMYNVGKVVVLDHNGFDVFKKLLDFDDPRIISGACDCLMILTSTKLGKKLAFRGNLLPILNRLIHHDNAAIYTSALSMLMFCTVNTNAKIAASQIGGLAKRLVNLCKDRFHPAAQLFALKALTNICEHPDVRSEVKEYYYSEVKEFIVGEDENLVAAKEVLLDVIGWAPYSKK